MLDGMEIKEAMSKNIRQRFSTDEFINIYLDKPVQSMVKPCVFINRVNWAHEPAMNTDANWRFIMDVRCHPTDTATDVESWADKVAVKLLDALTWITLGTLQIKAYDVQWNVVDNVLHFMPRYQFRVKKQVMNDPLMQVMHYGEHVKEERMG